MEFTPELLTKEIPVPLAKSKPVSSLNIEQPIPFKVDANEIEDTNLCDTFRPSICVEIYKD